MSRPLPSAAANANRVVRSEYKWAHIADLTLKTYRRVVQEARAGDWAYTT